MLHIHRLLVLCQRARCDHSLPRHTAMNVRRVSPPRTPPAALEEPLRWLRLGHVQRLMQLKRFAASQTGTPDGTRQASPGGRPRSRSRCDLGRE